MKEWIRYLVVKATVGFFSFSVARGQFEMSETQKGQPHAALLQVFLPPSSSLSRPVQNTK